MPHLSNCGACASVRLHFAVYWASRFRPFMVLLGPRYPISAFAARAPACAFILCFTGRVVSRISRSHSNPDASPHQFAPACAFILCLTGQVASRISRSHSNPDASVHQLWHVRQRAPSFCALLGESLPAFHGRTRLQMPQLTNCGACASVRLHFTLYWASRLRHFTVAFKSRYLSSAIAARAPACAFILRFTGRVASDILRSHSNPDTSAQQLRCVRQRAPSFCALLGESLPTFYGRIYIQIPQLSNCGSCASVLLHFVLYWASRFRHFAVAFKSRCLGSAIAALVPARASILRFTGRVASGILRSHSNADIPELSNCGACASARLQFALYWESRFRHFKVARSSLEHPALYWEGRTVQHIKPEASTTRFQEVLVSGGKGFISDILQRAPLFWGRMGASSCKVGYKLFGLSWTCCSVQRCFGARWALARARWAISWTAYLGHSSACAAVLGPDWR
jgi:hypothetical protein